MYSNLEEYMNRECANCFTDDKHRICLINIPKNASSYFRIKYDLKNVRYIPEKHLYYTNIVIFRDPADRIWSSFAELLKCRSDGPCDITRNTDFYKQKDITLFLDFIKGNLYDVHLFPQHQFLARKNLDITDMDWVYDFKDIDLLDRRLESIFKTFKNSAWKNSKSLQVQFEIDRNKIAEIYPRDVEIYDNLKKYV